MRDDLRPWELGRDPPAPTVGPTPTPTRGLDLASLPPVDERVRRRVRAILSPYDEEEF